MERKGFFFTEEEDTRLTELEALIEVEKQSPSEKSEQIIQSALLEIEDIWAYYTSDSEEEITVSDTQSQWKRPLRVKGMPRRLISFERKLLEKEVWSIPELRKFEEW